MESNDSLPHSFDVISAYLVCQSGNPIEIEISDATKMPAGTFVMTYLGTRTAF